MNDYYEEEDEHHSTPNANSGSGSSGQIIEQSPIELSEVSVKEKSKEFSRKVSKVKKTRKVLVSKTILNEAIRRN